MTGDQEEVDTSLLRGGTLPGWRAAPKLTEGGEENGWRKYWLTETPETAAKDDDTLIYLLLNLKTDEADAFRTSRRMMENGEAPVDVSLFFFRDEKADARSEEIYNILFFTTPENEKSLVRIFTDIPRTGRPKFRTR